MSKHFFSLCTSLLCLSSAISISSAYAATQVEQYTLKNGLQVIIRPDHRTPMVMSQIWYKVGSTDESGNTLGVAHVLEHMMFKGTYKVPNDEFTRLSRRYGGRINASTFTNYTNYYQLYPKAYFPLALELEADRMTNLQLREEDLRTELKVVMEERRQRTDNSARNVAFERFKWISYPTSHYRQPVIGHMKTLNQIQFKDVQQWYKTWYAPNNAILVIVGDVEPKSTLKQVEKYFGGIAKQELPIRNDVQEFEQLGYRHMQIKTNVQLPQLYMTWNVKSLASAPQPEDAFALLMTQQLLDSGISSRLQQRLVQQQKLLSSVSVRYDPYQRGDALFSISAMPSAKVSLADARKAIETEIEKLATEHIEPREFQRIQSRLNANLVYGQDDLTGQAQLLGNWAVNGLDLNMLGQLPQIYQRIDQKRVQAAIRRYLVEDNLSTLHLLPQTTTGK